MANPFIIPVRIDAKGVTKGLNNISSKFKTFGKNLTLAVSLPLAGIATAASKMALGFDESMTKINTLVGISKKELAGMRDEVMQIAGETAQAPAALADALFTVTSAGLRGRDAMEVLNMAAKSSASGLGETRSVAQALTGIMQSYAKSGMTAGRATDVLTATVRAGNLEASELAPVLGRVTGIASQVGVSFEEVGASIATFTRLGVNSAEAVTGLSGILNSIVKPTDQTHDALETLNMDMDMLRQSIKEKGLAATLVDLVGKVGDNQDVMGELIPNVRALSAVLGTAGAQGEDYIKVAEEIANSTGLADQVFKDTAESASFKFKKSLNQLSVVGTEIGTMLLPPLVKVTTAISTLIKKFMDLDGTTKTLVIVLGTLAAAAGPLITAFGFLISPIGLAITAITTLGVIVHRNFEAILGFTADVINAFKSFYNSSLILKDPIEALGVAWETVVNFFKAGINSLLRIFEGFGSVLEAIWNRDFSSIGDLISDTFSDLKDEFKFAGEESAKSYEEAFSQTLNKNLEPTTKEGLKESLTNAVNGVKGFFEEKGKELGQFLGIGINKSVSGEEGGEGAGEGTGDESGGGKLIQPIVSQLDELKDKSTAIAESVSDEFGNMASSIVESFELANNGIQGFFQKLFETLIKLTQMIVKQGIIRRLQAKKNIAAEQGEAIATSVKNATVSAAGTGPAAIFTQPAFLATLVGGVLAAFASIPKFAKGGIVTGPTLGLVGEAGPEAIIPLNKLSSVVGSQKGEFILRGSDLVLALDRANDFKTRITG